MCGFCLRVFTPPRECARALRRSRPRILAPQEYMEGDSRFRKMKLQRINVRKVIRMWADKERMNLLRMTRAAVPCPRPLKLKGHVLIMSFIGVSARFCMFACVCAHAHVLCKPARLVTLACAGRRQAPVVCQRRSSVKWS